MKQLPPVNKRFNASAKVIVLACIAASAAYVSTSNASEDRGGIAVVEFTTPSGIPVRLVEEHSVPIISLSFGFKGGSSTDPVGKEGTAKLTSDLLDNGTTELTGPEFQEKLADLASQFSISTGRTSVTGQITSLSTNFAPTIKLVGQALSTPRFDKTEFEKAKREQLTDITFDKNDPGARAKTAILKGVLKNTLFSRQVAGTAKSIKAVTLGDIANQYRQMFTRSRLMVTIVGDITKSSAIPLVEQAFASLPPGQYDSKTARQPSRLHTTHQSLPTQRPRSTTYFALPVAALGTSQQLRLRHFAAKVLNHILGSGNFDARLTKVLRVERGLTYSVASTIVTLDRYAFALGTFSTKASDNDEAVKLLKSVLKKTATEGPTQDEVANAKASLIGSYLLKLDTSAKLSSTLLKDALAGRSANFLNERTKSIRALTQADIQDVARKILNERNLSLVSVAPEIAKP